MRTAVLLAVVAAAGCGRPLEVDMSKVAPAPEHAAEAVSAVTAMYRTPAPPTVYGTNTGPGPTLYFYAGEPECDGGFEEYGDCYDGATSDDGGTVIVRIPPEGVTLGEDTDGIDGDASLPHELAHLTAIQLGNGPDNEHRSHWFAPGGEVAQATAMLVDLGM
jgi:hypothetical protein